MLFNNHYSYIENDVPVIFIPGLFGSMSNEIIPGTGEWSFGIAKLVYDPFIEILLKMGYTLNKDLFISFYDWRKSCEYSARKYLLETIDHVKEKQDQTGSILYVIVWAVLLLGHIFKVIFMIMMLIR